MEFSPVAPDHEALDCRLPPRQTAPVVVASPHSGSVYPAAFLAQAAVPLAALRRAEDAFVDELFAAAPSLGMPLLAARFPRSYVDANREPYELDPGMFEGPLPRPLNHRTTRVAAGLGMIPRVAASGEAIYRGRVPSDEIEQRLETCWRPYHTALSTLIEQTHRLFGSALLIDAHSMPSSASGVGAARARPPRRHRAGRQSWRVLRRRAGRLRRALAAPATASGSSATSPMPAASPPSAMAARALGRHALQIEINRGALHGRSAPREAAHRRRRRAADGRPARGDRGQASAVLAAPPAGGRVGLSAQPRLAIRPKKGAVTSTARV